MSTRSLEDVPEEGPPTPSGSPSGFRPTNSRKGPPSIRTLGQGRSSSDTSSLRRISSSSSSTAVPPTAVALTTKEKSSRTSGTLHKVRSSPRLPHDPEVEAAPSTVLYWSKAPVFGVIPTRTMRAHTVTLVDTTAWLFGGCDDKECSRDIFCFDTETMQWSRPETVGETPPPSRAHTATLVDRKIVVYGGGQGSTYYDSIYVLDTVTRRWSRPAVAGVKPPPRRAHTGVLYHGKIYMFGGGNGMTALNDVWTLDVTNVAKMRWEELQTTGRKPSHRGYHTANLIGNVMIVVGGSDGKDCFNDIWCLNLDTLRWTKLLVDTPHRRLSHTSTQVGSYLFIIGGHDGTRYRSDLLLFNLVSLAFEPRSTLGKAPSARGYHVTLLADSRLFLFGGFNGTTPFDEVHLLDLAAAAYLPQVTHFDIQLPE
ncbi:galactose oxidase [Mycena albidolilacea]|uniref:Galactose oxidase n=1 Tax=Mycena albidolilacea TaxID=1033008 RepID=A0AAD7EVS0_9AGAR|nr:galactose oxidase [Mycena albidolilacea]